MFPWRYLNLKSQNTTTQAERDAYTSPSPHTGPANDNCDVPTDYQKIFEPSLQQSSRKQMDMKLKAAYKIEWS